MVVVTTYLKPRKWPLLIMYLLVAFPFLIVKLLSDNNDAKNTFFIIAIVFAHALVGMFWYVLTKMEIQIYNQSIRYKTLLHSRELNWNEIIDISLSLGFVGNHPDSKWIFSSRNKSITISPSYFSRADNRILAEIAVACCSSAKISGSVRNLSNGKFPWYVF